MNEQLTIYRVYLKDAHSTTLGDGYSFKHPVMKYLPETYCYLTNREAAEKHVVGLQELADILLKGIKLVFEIEEITIGDGEIKC